jgi:hypothetical protein
MRKELTCAEVGNLSAQPSAHALNPRVKAILRLMNYLGYPLQVYQGKYGEDILFIEVKSSEFAGVLRFAVQIARLETD